MFHRTLPLIFLLLVAGSRLGWAGDNAVITADTGWQHVDTKSGVELYARARPGSGVKEFKGTGLINAKPAAVEKVISDVAAYTRFMPYVSEAKVISTTGNVTVTYQRLDCPIVSNRDYTVRVEHGTLAGNGGAMTYRDTWETDNDDGPPELKGVVRVKVNEGLWLLEPAGPGGASTQATYQIFTDSGGALPAFLANHASETAIPKLFDAIRKQVTDPKYAQ